MTTLNGPDFIIMGAMKSGTSSLKHLLQQHPEVYMPDDEIAFFNIDEIFEHHDFYVYNDKDWHVPDFNKVLDKYADWYHSFFDTDREYDVKGEHSTTYLSSEVAVARIETFLPQVKLIVILRDPVERTYSHYWHNVETGRAIYSFERTLQFTPEKLIKRSLYNRQLKRIQGKFTDDQLKVILFEEFVKNPTQSANEILEFIGEQPVLNEADLKTQANESNYPFSLSLQLFFNSIYRKYGVKSYLSRLPYGKDYDMPSFINLLRKLLFATNLNNRKEKPRMNLKTREFLENYFNHKLESLPEILDRELHDVWPWFEN